MLSPSQKFVWIGIDQSLRSSGVFWLGDGVTGWARIEAKKLRGTERLKFIKDAVIKIVDDLDGYTVKRVAIEGYAYGIRGGRVFELGELGGVLKLALTEHGCSTITTVQPTTLKKFAGSGNAEKEDVIKFVNKEMEMGFTLKENDVADACVLALISRQLDEPTTKIRQQLEVLKTLQEG